MHYVVPSLIRVPQVHVMYAGFSRRVIRRVIARVLQERGQDGGAAGDRGRHLLQHGRGLRAVEVLGAHDLDMVQRMIP